MCYIYRGLYTISSFTWYGKKSAWGAWRVCPAVTETFVTPSRHPNDISEEVMCTIQSFLIPMYNRICPLSKVDEARRCFSSSTQKWFCIHLLTSPENPWWMKNESMGSWLVWPSWCNQSFKEQINYGYNPKEDMGVHANASWPTYS